ncbi:deoxyribodipyrimidine photo-lyase [Desulfovibrio mangrovi]|uniref:deoxyribodipyrimidine photo-lyase n=1 Tax=Desulfovibrio mangrovi TaxID=2976983 RepID=UPI002246ACAC|nr:deoxyribodipyrimidine photo-lyase [Desulfovibrio mangrovi]UZP66270.1 deoxyribodipyrimidine photo-lyase [Desulfovibrio mangrovi]
MLYWMHREHRCRDNWALIHALEEAARCGVSCAVAYGLAPAFLGACIRQFGFLLGGLERTAAELATVGVPFILVRQSPDEAIPELARSVGASLIVTDFDPLRLKRQWIQAVCDAAPCAVVEVDSRNVVPCRVASDKREYAARTIRPKIHRLLDEYLDDFPAVPPLVAPWRWQVPPVDWEMLRAGLGVDRTVPEVSVPFGPEAGEDAARAMLVSHLSERMPLYEQRNDPNAPAVSGLSPYLHFGMISAQRVVLETLARRGGKGLAVPAEARESFLEELVVRRELSDNFCLHTPEYDGWNAFPDWAQRTLDKHRADNRDYLYSLETLESGDTHDPLWNAAQKEMRLTGYMHGYLRMYWAKKILEWSASPEEAMRHAVYLNDRYFIDGRDSNGYTGVAWSMGGVHDRPWQERPVFGTIRYMNYAGARRKFDVNLYAARMEALESRMRDAGAV